MSTMNPIAQAMFDEDLMLFLKQETVDSLRILLVEDDQSEALAISALLEQYGHKVHTAHTGAQAIKMFRKIRPSLVLMDAVLPGMSGYEATRAIRDESKEWIPIIFLSGHTEMADRLYAIKMGADDFFPKPIDPIELVAKMNVMSRIHRMQSQLNKYVETHEADDELAAHVIARYLNASQNDRRVEYSILSASHHFSGDVISVAKTPDGGLNVMMLDAMGHGLSAAISALPAIQAFYAMSKKDIPLTLLVPEINDKVRELSPPGHFLAGAFLHFNYSSSELIGWIGGTPKIYLYLDGNVQPHSSNNLPLGVLPSSELDFKFFISSWSDKSMLVTCTDGVLEAKGGDGTELGDEWIYGVIQKYGHALDMVIFDMAWKESLAGNTPHDDASVLIIRQSIAKF